MVTPLSTLRCLRLLARGFRARAAGVFALPIPNWNSRRKQAPFLSYIPDENSEWEKDTRKH
jgi:hypothetical protein